MNEFVNNELVEHWDLQLIAILDYLLDSWDIEFESESSLCNLKEVQEIAL